MERDTRSQSIANGLDWALVDAAYLYELMNEVSRLGGRLTFMFGGWGHYYAIDAYIDDRCIKVTAESPERLIGRAYRQILGYDI